MHNLKRAGSNPAGPAPTTKKSRPLYETPFPNPSSDNLAYKLPSSAPRAGGTGNFSPVACALSPQDELQEPEGEQGEDQVQVEVAVQVEEGCTGEPLSCLCLRCRGSESFSPSARCLTSSSRTYPSRNSLSRRRLLPAPV